MESILNGWNNTYVRNVQEFETERKITVYFGLETISYRFPQLWSLLLFFRRLKEVQDSGFVTVPVHADCVKYGYLQNVGFL